MQGMPSLWNMSRLRGSSSKASLELEAVAAQLGHRGALEPRRLGVVAAVAHHEHVPAQAVVRQPGQGLGLHAQGTAGEQHDAQARVEELEQAGDLAHQGVVPAGVEEGVPVAPSPLQEVLAAGRVGQHPVDVEDDRRPGRRRPTSASTSSGAPADGHAGALVTCALRRARLSPRWAAPSTGAGSPRPPGDRPASWCRPGRGPRPRRAAAGA